MRASAGRGLFCATDNSIKLPNIVSSLLSTESTMTFPYTACAKIETTFLEIDTQLKALHERFEEQCNGEALLSLLFQNSQSSGLENVVLLECPEELLGEMGKSIEWMKGARDDISGMRTMMFENKFGEKKEKLAILLMGKVLLSRPSEVGENKKTLITGDHKGMKEDVASPGNEVPSFYGKFASLDNTQRTLFLLPLEKEMAEVGGYTYMPEEDEKVNGVLKDLSDLSMKVRTMPKA